MSDASLAAGDKVLERDRCAAAIDIYSAYIAANPESVKGYWRRALVRVAEAGALARPALYDSAREDLDRAIQISPNVADFYLLRSLARRGAMMETIRHKKFKFNPFKPGAFLQNGISDVASAAFADCSKAIDLDPKMGEAYTERYAVDELMKDDRQAAYDQRKANLLDPEGMSGMRARDRMLADAEAQVQANQDRAMLGLFMVGMAARGY